MVSFQKACEDVLENNSQYKRDYDVGIRLSDLSNEKYVKFFNVKNNEINILQVILNKDINSDWIKIEKKDDYYNYLSEIKKLANVESNFSKAQYEFMKFIKLIKKDILIKAVKKSSVGKLSYENVSEISDKRSGLK